MDANLKKLKDAVANAGARYARAALNLEVAHEGLEKAKAAYLAANKKAAVRFDVRLLASGPQKIVVIKTIRELMSLGLKEAKDVVDFAGYSLDARSLIARNVDEDRAEEIRKAIEAVGGAVSKLAVGSLALEPPLHAVTS